MPTTLRRTATLCPVTDLDPRPDLGRLSGVTDPQTPPADVRHRLDDGVELLRSSGARFVFLHGSRAAGTAGRGSDIDLAAHFGGAPVDLPRLVSLLPAQVDLLVLDDAPLELAGRVAARGVLLWEGDAAERVEWVARTRKVWADEQPRIDQARRDFAAAQRRRRG
jgi:predicted nucleotidyltransferase